MCFRKKRGTSGKDVRKKAERSINPTGSYTLKLTCIVLAAALVIVSAFSIIFYKREAQQSIQDTLEFAERIESLEKALLEGDPDDERTEYYQELYLWISSTNQNNTSLQEAASYLQIQYDSFVDQINFLFIILTVVLGIITLVIPIFNYAFVQKERIERIEKAFAEQQEQFLKLKEQGFMANEASLLPDDKQSEEMPAVSDKPEDKAQALFMEALRYIRRKLYQRAIQTLSKAIKLDPKEARYFDMRGLAYHMAKRYEEALNDANKAIELEPENARYYNSRGVTLHEMKRYEEALKDMNKAIELEPENARYYNSRGVTLHALKCYEEALKDKNKAIALEPENAEYYNSRGVTLHEMKRYEEALKDTNKAIELEPENAEYYDSRGATLHEMKRYEEALKDTNKAIELEPNSAIHYHSKGVALHQMNRDKEALEVEKLAIELDPDNMLYVAFAARCNIVLGNYSKAKSLIEKAVLLDPSNHLVRRVRGLYQFALLKRNLATVSIEEIQADFDYAVTNDSGGVYPLVNRIEFNLYINHLDKVKEDLDRAIQQDQLEPKVYYLYSKYYEAVNDDKKAAEYRKLADEHGYIPEPPIEDKKDKK